MTTNRRREAADEIELDENDEPIEEAVDLDLDAEDALLREAVGSPISVRLDGKVVHISHTADWSNEAMSAASSGDWNKWAEEVIDDDDELDLFIDANLKNYQYEAIFNECGKQSGTNAKKLRQRARSSRRTQRR